MKCNRNFQSKKQLSRFQTKLWNEYVWKKQSVLDLTEKYKRSNKWIRQQLDQVEIKVSNDSTKPQPIIIVADATFFGRTYGVIVFREPNLKKNLYWKEIAVENLSAYWQGRTFLEKKRFTVQAAVTDGKRCARAVFSDIPTQMCHFHQVLIITRYLTKRPKLEAGKELRKITLLLTKSNEKEFTILLNNWFEKWKEFLKERTINPETGK